MNDTKIEPTAIRSHRMKTYKALLAFLPPKWGYARKMAKSLNMEGRVSGRGRVYTELGVHSIVAQGTYDRHVEDELVAMVVGYTGQPIKKLLPDYKPTYEMTVKEVEMLA